MFTPIGFYSPTVSVVTSAYYTADIWGMTNVNSTYGAYNKNSGSCDVGKFYRGPGSQYVSEILCKSESMMAALSGKTIQDFQIEYTVATNSVYAGTQAAINVFKCDVDWTDVPQSQPVFNAPFAPNVAWATNLVADSLIWEATTPVGTKTISKSSSLTSLVQAWANDTVNNNGVILGMKNSYYNSKLVVSGVRFWVQYI